MKPIELQAKAIRQTIESNKSNKVTKQKQIKKNRIKLESLILAQSERWRRA